ncbi:MAG TPA: universal stress protein [Chitinophagaceae bacterium]|nr:universal stress protein [Chitinophagaceae bacterium]
MAYNKILIAVDDSPVSERVAVAGFALAKQLGAESALVSVVDTSLPAGDGITPGELAAITKNDLKKAQEIIIEKVFGGHKIWAFVDEGKPHETILKIAGEWQADLIVIGTHGRTGLSHLLTGSVAEKVIRHSVKPLLVVPVK